MDETPSLTPEQFESAVENILLRSGVEISDVRIRRREYLSSSDGTYEVDITARFQALGCDFLVLIECKHHRHPIKRDVVQVLESRVRSLGAHKGMLFSTSRFQTGAVSYAEKHGIALVRIAGGALDYVRRVRGAYDGFLVTAATMLSGTADQEMNPVYTVLDLDRLTDLLRCLGYEV